MAADPGSLADWAQRLRSTGDELEALVHEADGLRRHLVGDVVTMVANRNVTSTGYRAAGPGDEPGEFGPDDLARIAADAAALGATELCVQGRLPQSEDPLGYLEMARIVKDAAPGLHLHAFRPADVDDLAVRTGWSLERTVDALREAGVDTLPGTGVKVLSERVRQLVAPADLPVDRWEAIIRTEHRAGLRTTSVLFTGHVETAEERVAHLERLLAIQAAAVEAGAGGGFSEFIPIPLAGWGTPLVADRSALDESRAMVAVARLVLRGELRHIQAAWPRVGPEHATALLRSGADDLGGTLLDGDVLPAAGVEHGIELPLAQGEAIAARLMRPFRQRTTLYGNVATAVVR